MINQTFSVPLVKEAEIPAYAGTAEIEFHCINSEGSSSTGRQPTGSDRGV